MLDKFRKLIQGWLGKALITLLLLPFALFGVSSIFQVNPNKKAVVEVNGVEIDERELRRAIEVSKQNLISRLGEQASSIVTNEMVQPAALESLISQELVRQSAEDNKLNVSMDAIHEMIVEMEVFQIDGKFSQSHFEELLRRNGLRPEIFPQKMRDEFLQRQLSSGYQSTGFSTASEIENLKSLYNQSRTFSYAELQSETILGQIEVTDEQVQADYDKNKESYRTEEQLIVDYLVVNRSQFADDLDVTDDEVAQRYHEKLQEIEESQERSASHILIEISDSRDKAEAKKLADELYSKVENGGGFSLLAAEFSDDKGSATKGGSLGFAGRGVYVDEFEETLFSLGVGEVSKPVLTEFGYHIIKLEAIQPQAESLASMRSQLIDEIKDTKAEQPYQDALEELKNLAYESSDLAEPAAYLRSEIKTSAKISRSVMAGESLLSDSAVTEAAFSEEVLTGGNNSDVLELADGRAVVLRLNKHFPSKVKAVAEVTPEIKAKLKQSLAKEKISTMADEILVSLKAGTSKGDIAKQYGLKWKEVENIKRDEDSVPRNIVGEVFKQPKPAQDKPYMSTFSLPNGNQLISILSQVNSDITPGGEVYESKISSSQSSDMQFNRLLENQKGSLEFQSFQAWLKSEAKIEKL
jgi:peptidyl-prolyl cis-trans isomerase D